MDALDLLFQAAEKIGGISIDVTEEKLLSSLDNRKRWPMFYPWGQPSVEIILDDGGKAQDFFDVDDLVIPEKLKAYYEEGYTLIFSNVGELFDDFKKVSDTLNDTFGRKFNINAYFGKGTKSVSFKKHTHEYPVLVKNVFGESDWVIQDEHITLENQNVLFFDAFTEHEVIKINSAKLSLTCNLTNCKFFEQKVNMEATLILAEAKKPSLVNVEEFY